MLSHVGSKPRRRRGHEAYDLRRPDHPQVRPHQSARTTFVEGDKLPLPPTVQWLTTREDAVAALPGLFEVDDDNDEEH